MAKAKQAEAFRPLPPAFPYFGGKRRAAPTVWSRFGDVQNYVEPFAGSLGVLFCRPHWPWDGHRIETVNDADCFLANVWRALQSDPDGVARHADWPVNEADLHARHLWLVNVGREHVQRLRTDPDYCDPKIAGWWIWGACQWIGSGWCHYPKWQQLPHLSCAGMGVHRPSQQLPHLGDAGRGVHRPSQQLPHLGDDGRAVLQKYFRLLADRLRRVRVCCGDWSRVCKPSVTTKHRGVTAVFLDPPYTAEANRKNNLYCVDDTDIGHAVREWAIEHGDDPRLRICLCGYDTEHKMPRTWKCLQGKSGSHGGYGNQNKQGNANAGRERLWFSPHCLRPRNR